jgi:hypothetical protein
MTPILIGVPVSLAVLVLAPVLVLVELDELHATTSRDATATPASISLRLRICLPLSRDQHGHFQGRLPRQPLRKKFGYYKYFLAIGLTCVMESASAV